MDFNAWEMANIDTMEFNSVTEASGWIENDVLENCDCDCRDDDK